MKLKRVVYELYEIDLLSLHDHPDWHEIDREIFLEFENGERVYFSWADKPVQFCVGKQDHRFNKNQPDHALDVSDWDMWRSLIGSDVSFISHDESGQVLELRGEYASIYLSSQKNGSWCSDVLHVSTKLPTFCC